MDEPNSYRTQREALLHLVFPDTFEAIVSSNHKHWIGNSSELRGNEQLTAGGERI